MSTERREAANLPERDVHYVDRDAGSIEEITDPRSKDDGQRNRVLEYYDDHPRVAIATLVAAVPLVVIAGFLVLRLAPGILSNRWVQAGAAIAAYTSLVVYFDRRAAHSARDQIDKVPLAMPNGEIKPLLGEHGTTPEGDPYIKPIRGFSSILQRPSGYITVEELDQDLALKYELNGGDPSDPAKILLRDEYLYVSRAEHGTYVVQLTNGIEVNGSGRSTQLVATRPDMADETQLKAANKLIEEQEQEISDLETQVANAERRQEDAEERARKNREEVIESFLKEKQKDAEAEAQRRYRTSSSTATDQAESARRNGRRIVDQQRENGEN